MALLTLLEDFELASLFLKALETPGMAEDDFPDLPVEATSGDLPWLLGVPVGEEDTSDDLPGLLGVLVGEDDTSDDFPGLVGVLVGEDDTPDGFPGLLGVLVGASIGDIVGTLPSAVAVGDVVGASVKAWGLLVGLASTGLTVGFVEGAT